MKESAIKQENSRAGVASLPVLLALSAILIVLGVLISSMSIADNQDGSNAAGSEKALANAQLGARDALVRMARNKNYSGNYSIDAVAGGCVAPFAGCAAVTVDSGSSPKKIESVGRTFASTRKVEVYVYLNNNGQIMSFDWRER